jgi:hypothetical protein
LASRQKREERETAVFVHKVSPSAFGQLIGYRERPQLGDCVEKVGLAVVSVV